MLHITSALCRRKMIVLFCWLFFQTQVYSLESNESPFILYFCHYVIEVNVHCCDVPGWFLTSDHYSFGRCIQITCLVKAQFCQHLLNFLKGYGHILRLCSTSMNGTNYEKELEKKKLIVQYWTFWGSSGSHLLKTSFLPVKLSTFTCYPESFTS